MEKSEKSSNSPVRLQRAERLTTFVLEVVKCLRIDNARGGLIEAQAPSCVTQTACRHGYRWPIAKNRVVVLY